MAADVTPLVCLLSGCKDDANGNGELITSDLLGSGGGAAAAVVSEVNPDRQSPVEWARSLDLFTPERSSSNPEVLAYREIQDLNLLPSSDELSLELAAAPVYQSVCTIEKVKSALERESRAKRTRSAVAAPSSSSSTSSSSAVGGVGGEGSMMAAGCPRCLLYVLICRGDPRCPRCDSHVPVLRLYKRLRFDLNSASGLMDAGGEFC